MTRPTLVPAATCLGLAALLLTGGCAAGPMQTETEAVTTAETVEIQVPATMIRPNFRFGLLQVRPEPEDDAVGSLPAREEIFFEHLGQGRLQASLLFEAGTKPQFRCFVNHWGVRHDRVQNLLHQAGFHRVRRSRLHRHRTWFITRTYPVCADPGHAIYNCLEGPATAATD